MVATARLASWVTGADSRSGEDPRDRALRNIETILSIARHDRNITTGELGQAIEFALNGARGHRAAEGCPPDAQHSWVLDSSQLIGRSGGKLLAGALLRDDYDLLQLLAANGASVDSAEAFLNDMINHYTSEGNQPVADEFISLRNRLNRITPLVRS